MTASTSPDPHLAEALATRYWREEQARVVLDTWVASGESMAAFARRLGLTVQRLRWWKRWLMPTTAMSRDEGGLRVRPEAVLPHALLLEAAEEARDEPVLLVRVGGDVLLRQAVEVTGLPVGTALEDEAVVAA